MSFCHVILTVKDLDASIKFYRDIVGLPIKIRQHAGPAVEIAFMGDGGTLIELFCGKSPFCDEINRVGNGVALGFSVESLEEKISLLHENGYETDGNIISPAPTVQFVLAKDPDGYIVQFNKRQ